MTERYGASAAAAYVGVAPGTWRAYVSRGQAPPPDGIDEGFGKSYWLESTLDTWSENRPGPGARTDLLAKVDEALEHPETFAERSRIKRKRPPMA